MARFRALLEERTGLRSRDEDEPRLEAYISARARERGLPNAKAYVRALTRHEGEMAREWDAIVERVTVGESYFFRDAAQFTLLRDRILPERLSARQHRPVRVWSAGCANGEEPYSLAILVDELLGPEAARRVEIVGTDLNPRAIEKARRATYRPWSLRTLEPERRDRYFTETHDGWVLAERIRERVRFATSNLAADALPDAARGLHDVDLVLCRNVFIYFASATTSAIARRIALALTPGGYLVTGHAELTRAHATGLMPRVFPGSVVYQRALASPPREPAPAHAPRLRDASRTRPQPASPPGAPPAVPMLMAEAEAAADRGDHEHARACCEQALDADPFTVRAYHLLARLAEERNAHAEAKRLLKKAMYAAPTAPGAYLELAFLYEREHDAARARHLRLAALDALNALPADARVDPYEGVTAAEVAAEVTAVLAGDPEEVAAR